MTVVIFHPAEPHPIPTSTSQDTLQLVWCIRFMSISQHTPSVLYCDYIHPISSDQPSSTASNPLLLNTMNNRPVEQALATLLPTHAQDLPQELLSLAISLVAQSRSFSSSLKPEEEIARPYACAEIACKRCAVPHSHTPVFYMH